MDARRATCRGYDAAMERPAPIERTTPQLTLLGAARIVARGGDLESELAALAGHVRAATGALAAIVYLLDPVGGRLVPAAGAGVDESVLTDSASLLTTDANELVARAATERRAMTADATVRASLLAGLAPPPRGAIALPLIAADETGGEDVEGVLLAGFAGEAPDPEAAEDSLFALADLCAVAVRKARLAHALVERSEWIERLASTDALTGLANRQTFERMLELEIARATRQESQLSLIVFDVEDFRGLNEREGAAAADDVLRWLASLLADQVRLVDTIGRLGHDEFGLIAPGGGGNVVAGRVRDAAAALRTKSGAPVAVRAVNVVFPADGGSAGELMAAAGVALGEPRIGGSGAVATARAG
jgi:diguanylate cyclase (GGDEF)-like protein